MQGPRLFPGKALNQIRKRFRQLPRGKTLKPLFIDPGEEQRLGKDGFAEVAQVQ